MELAEGTVKNGVVPGIHLGYQGRILDCGMPVEERRRRNPGNYKRYNPSVKDFYVRKSQSFP